MKKGMGIPLLLTGKSSLAPVSLMSLARLAIRFATVALFSLGGCSVNEESTTPPSSTTFSPNPVSAVERSSTTDAVRVESETEPRETESISDEGKLVVNGVSIELVQISSGTFRMGDLRRGVKIAPKNMPHDVTITRDFWMSRYEVTVRQFSHFTEATGYKTFAETSGESIRGYNSTGGVWGEGKNYTWQSPGFPQTGDHPVVYIGWNDAVAFCDWLNTDSNCLLDFRLPTEAEWEYACRAGTSSQFSFGDDISGLPDYGNFPDLALASQCPACNHLNAWNDLYPCTAPVGSFKPNPFGLFDVYGNVWEWCADRGSPKYYSVSPKLDPQGPEFGLTRVARGGSWASFIVDSSFRNSWEPNNVSSSLGLRLVATKK